MSENQTPDRINGQKTSYQLFDGFKETSEIGKAAYLFGGFLTFGLVPLAFEVFHKVKSDMAANRVNPAQENSQTPAATSPVFASPEAAMAAAPALADISIPAKEDIHGNEKNKDVLGNDKNKGIHGKEDVQGNDTNKDVQGNDKNKGVQGREGGFAEAEGARRSEPAHTAGLGI